VKKYLIAATAVLFQPGTDSTFEVESQDIAAGFEKVLDIAAGPGRRKADVRGAFAAALA
jgi:hypothetical protein